MPKKLPQRSKQHHYPPVVILGGGVAGLAAGLYLAERGERVIILEKAPQVGGAAASLTIPEDRLVPAGYHQIVGSDQPLIKMLKKLGLYDKVAWKQTHISTLVEGRSRNLASPFDMLQFPLLPLASRVRYLLFGARCLLTKHWQGWFNRSVSEFITSWADSPVLEHIFKPLVDIKFGFSTDQADAAWLGQRLSSGEGAAPFGYIPNTSWTEQLCHAMTTRIEKLGGKIYTNTGVTHLKITQKKLIMGVVTDQPKTIPARVVLSTLPPPITTKILAASHAPASWSTQLKPITYIGAYSLLAGLSTQPFLEYWTIFLHPRRIFGGCFTISILNETLKTKKDAAVINLFTNIPAGEKPWTLAEYEQRCLADLRQATGQSKLKFNWVKSTIIPFVSPVFTKGYQNPKAHLGGNLFGAGIYRTYPKLSSTGEAMADGMSVAKEVQKWLAGIDIP